MINLHKNGDEYMWPVMILLPNNFKCRYQVKIACSDETWEVWGLKKSYFVGSWFVMINFAKFVATTTCYEFWVLQTFKTVKNKIKSDWHQSWDNLIIPFFNKIDFGVKLKPNKFEIDEILYKKIRTFNFVNFEDSQKFEFDEFRRKLIK